MNFDNFFKTVNMNNIVPNMNGMGKAFDAKYNFKPFPQQQPIQKPFIQQKIKSNTKNKIIELAYKLKDLLTPYTYNIEIAGSIRRGQSPRDIDIVLIPKDRTHIYNVIKSLGTVKAYGDVQLFAVIQGIDVDIFFSDWNSFGAQLLHSTGPAGSNIGKRQIAKKQGMMLNNYGLYKDNVMVAGRTEKEIYEALGRTYKPPEERGKQNGGG
jgi:DNA polymerase (family X)